MAITLLSPPASFVKFNIEPEDHCIWGVIDLPLPVIYPDDVAFQFILQTDTEEEAAGLSTAYVQIGLVKDCEDDGFLIEFSNPFERSKVKANQVLYNWGWGFPGFAGVLAFDECFYVRVKLGDQEWCATSRFQRKREDCFTSVIEYGSDGGNAFGFFACGTDITLPDAPVVDCRPTAVQFSNVATLTIPYTASLQDKYGDVPSVQVWIYDTGGKLVNMGVQASLIGYPTTSIEVDLGGQASGVVRIS